MKGNPRFNVGDAVKFECDGIKATGEVYIVDEYGTFEQPDDVSYDIMSTSCLYKHIPERMVSKKIFKKFGEFFPNDMDECFLFDASGNAYNGTFTWEEMNECFSNYKTGAEVAPCNVGWFMEVPKAEEIEEL